MQITLIEPYYGGSHRAWADGYQRFSHYDVRLLTLPAQFWKWRMQGGAVSLARLLHEGDFQPDAILASDMFNLATFRALTRDRLRHCPIALYFHENQMTYPQGERQAHGWRYGFVNYISALAADALYFNSPYHLDVFFETLPRMLKHFGDFNELQTVAELRSKAEVLSLGLDLRRFDTFSNDYTKKNHPDEPPLIIWNHRWDEDKNPVAFFQALDALAEAEVPFRVALTGENTRQNPSEFEEARRRLGQRVVQYGYMSTFADYARLLWQADYVVSTANQEFFGAAVAEAIYCGCVPILPQRLSYPHLLPASAHKVCLYPGNSLTPRLKRHLMGEYDLDSAALRAALRAHIAQFDWSGMAPRYDDHLSALAQGLRPH